VSKINLLTNSFTNHSHTRMSTDKRGDLQVAMHNNLVSCKNYLGEGPKRSLYRLSITDRRLLLYIIARGIKNHRSDEDIPNHYEIRIQDMAGYMKLTHSELYNQVERSVERLSDTTVIYNDPEDGHLVRTKWLSGSHYWEGEGRIKIAISQELKPVLTGLQEQYVLMDLATCGRLGSAYAMRLYELLKSRQKMKIFTIAIDELREILAAEEKYGRFCNFNLQLLKPALKQIHARTDLKVKYGKGNARGRKWTHIAFEVKVKSATEMKLAEKVEDEYMQSELIPELKNYVEQSRRSLARGKPVEVASKPLEVVKSVDDSRHDFSENRPGKFEW